MAKGKMDEMVEGGASGAQDEAESAGTGLELYNQKPEFSQDDVFLNRLRLAQGLTKEVQDGSARPGQYLVTGFAPEESVTLVPIGFGKMREHRNPDDGREMLCYSKDALIGEGDPGGACAECPLNQWTPNPDKPGKNKPPICKFSYGYLFYSEQHDAVVAYRFKGMALNAGKGINTIVNHHGLRKVAITMGSEQKSGPSGSYYIPNVTVVAEPDPALLEAAVTASGG